MKQMLEKQPDSVRGKYHWYEYENNVNSEEQVMAPQVGSKSFRQNC